MVIAPSSALSALEATPMTSLRRSLPFVLVLLLSAPCAALAVVKVMGTPFPSDIYTVPNHSHLTGVQVNLPKPDCGVRPSDCADIGVLNTLDGFNLQPRISIAFTGPIDPSSVSSSTVYLVSIGCNICGPGGKLVGINQAVWEPAANTLHVESDELLDQHSRYLLVVTRGVRDADGHPLGATTFLHDLNFGQTKDPALKAYGKTLIGALDAVGLEPDTLAGVSLFTTQSATAVLQKIRDQIKASTPPRASFALGPAGARTVFQVATITSITFDQQRAVAGPPTTVSVPIVPGLPDPAAALAAVLGLSPDAIGTIAFGQYQSPDYLTPVTRLIPPIGTATGIPAVQALNTIQFNLFLPSSAKPARGYPVAIFGHGFGDNKNNSPFYVAATLAHQGIATIAINVVGHGRGAASTLTVNRPAAAGGPVTFGAGSRGYDQDGNGTIDSTEGVNALAPLIGNRDGLRQTVADLMQVVRVIQIGVDVDGDGVADLDASRIYYYGQSFGGIYGTKLLAVEPDIKAGVPNVPGGAIIEIARLSPVFRPLVTLGLAARTPALLNGGPGGIPSLGIPGFTENIPLRNKPILVDTIPLASAIQEVIDNTEWVSQSGNPVAYAPHIRKSPLDGAAPKPVIFQFAKGDQTVPNPTTTAILRAGDLADRATYFRNDLNLPGANPHTFLTLGVGILPGLQAQTQIAMFFETGVVVDPDGSGPLFEVPIAGPLPEELNF